MQALAKILFCLLCYTYYSDAFYVSTLIGKVWTGHYILDLFIDEARSYVSLCNFVQDTSIQVSRSKFDLALFTSIHLWINWTHSLSWLLHRRAIRRTTHICYP